MFIISDFKMLENENYYSYLWRLDGLVQSGKYRNWKEITPMVNKELYGDDESQYRDESAFRKACKYARDFKDAGVFDNEDEYLKELQQIKRESEKVLKKIQTEKLEYNKWLREEARDEMITDKICESISLLSPLDIPDYIQPIHNKESHLLAFADCHYGIEFEIKDLFGNIINKYSPEIFEQRMWDLKDRLIEKIIKEDISELTIWELGDGLDGILRLNSQLMKLRYGIIESSILYANFISEWLNEISRYTRIKFQMVFDSNHNQLRIVNAPKNSFKDENMSRIMWILIKERLKNNPNITFIENPTGMNYSQMSTYSVLGIHGEVKNLENSINEFSRAYGIQLDYLIGGHCHHANKKETGISSEVLTVGSVIGVDPYGMSLNKTSSSSASLFTFEQGYGKVCEYTFKLN